MNKEKEEIIKDHLRYAEHVEKKFRELRRQSEERVQMLIERYNELVDVFEKRPSRSEDLAIIRQLQEEGLDKEEEMRRMSEKIRSSESVRREEIKVFSAQQVLGMQTMTMTPSADKSRKNTKSISPVNAGGSLPPISISQFSIQLRSPPSSNGLMTSKKFFK